MKGILDDESYETLNREIETIFGIFGMGYAVSNAELYLVLWILRKMYSALLIFVYSWISDNSVSPPVCQFYSPSDSVSKNPNLLKYLSFFPPSLKIYPFLKSFFKTKLHIKYFITNKLEFTALKFSTNYFFHSTSFFC